MNSPSAAPEEIDERTGRIRALNDQLRTTFSGGQLFLTPGIRDLGEDGVMAVLDVVKEFDDFSEANDPHGEHDFGSFKHEGQTIFWKIDCYDKDLAYGSPDPTDPAVTSRVLTVLLSSEY
ncbi:MAG: DUF3768 domain-containing protein [Pseudomonadota bacterium]